nr:helix-turn-helix transcriptional regulator [uncultured Niameybacter sp.]
MKENFVGNLLRMERIKQGKGQKEICYGICVTSYLCKIEKGQVKADEQMIKKLFEQLNIDYCNDDGVLDEARKLMKAYHYQVNYGLERTAFGELKKLGDKLQYSPLGLDYQLICGIEGEDVYDRVKSCKDCMTDEQKGLFYLLTPIDKGWEELLGVYEKAYKLLGTSSSYFAIFDPLLHLGRYGEIHRRANICRELAIEEGNTYVLAQTFFMQGHAYAILDLDELMVEYYERGLKFLQNTRWIEEEGLDTIYYNMGSVFITTKDYNKAMDYLNKVREESFVVCQKKALIHIRTGNLEEAKPYLAKMKAYIEKEEDNKVYAVMYEEALMEQRPDYLKDPAYLEVLERLQKVLKEEMHFGYLYFYREQIVKAYSQQKKYKKALAFQNEISSKIIHM